MTSRIDIIRSELQGDPEGLGYAELGSNYPAIAERMNQRPLVTNPVAEAPLVLKRLGIRDLFAAITPTEARALYMIPGFRDDVQKAAEAGDRVVLQMYVAIGAPDLSANSIAALTALMQATEADPTWSAQIPGDSRSTVLGVAPVRATDVQEAMN
jgi:hypothetical protein